MTEDDLIETLCRAICDAEKQPADKMVYRNPGGEEGPLWKYCRRDARRFLAMWKEMKAYEDAKRKYDLKDLLGKCDPNAPLSQEDKEWL